MNANNLTKRFTFSLLFAVVTLTAAVAQADPPTRVARLGQISGQVSFAPAGEDEWVVAQRNRPIVIGDRLWVAEGGHAELQMGAALVRLDGGTSVAILNLDDRIAQLRVEQGALDVRARRFGADDQFEIDTPNLAFAIRRPGAYRIDVDPANDTTFVATRSGAAEVYGQEIAYSIASGQRYAFTGTRLEAARYSPPPSAAFDAWVQTRERRYDRSVSARYVAPDVIGYEDLDDQGTWRVVAQYGNVWIPRRVPANWAPYRYGHWAWIDPWGWTWVDDAPWGFAPFHYGRWARVGTSWGWVPGPIAVRPVYAPALVAFVGGSGVSVSLAVGSAPQVAWFPLAPGEVYRPAYQASRNYFTSVNTSNTKINVTRVTNIYNNRTTINEVRYVYREQPVAVTAVPTTVFAQAEPIARARLQVDRNALKRARVVETAAVAPVAASVIGNAPKAAARPRADLHKRATIARAEPPAAPKPFSARHTALAANPGGSPAQDSSRRAKVDAAEPEPRVSDPKGSPPGPGSGPITMVAPNTKARPLPATNGRETSPPRAKEPMAERPKGKERERTPAATRSPAGRRSAQGQGKERERAPATTRSPAGRRSAQGQGKERACAPAATQSPAGRRSAQGQGKERARASATTRSPARRRSAQGQGKERARASATTRSPARRRSAQGQGKERARASATTRSPARRRSAQGQGKERARASATTRSPAAAEAPKGKVKNARAPPPPHEAPQAEEGPERKDQVARAPAHPDKDQKGKN